MPWCFFPLFVCYFLMLSILQKLLYKFSSLKTCWKIPLQHFCSLVGNSTIPSHGLNVDSGSVFLCRVAILLSNNVCSATTTCGSLAL